MTLLPVSAIRSVFLVNGLMMGCFAAHLPLLKARLELSEGLLGLMLLTMSGAAIVAMLFGGPWLDRIGSRFGLTLGAIAMAMALPWLGIVPDSYGVFLVLAIFGAGNGLMDVAMNAHGASVQALVQRSVMSSLHGFFSLGGLFAAALTAMAVNFEIDGAVLLAAVVTAMMLLLAFAWPTLLPASAEDLDSGGTKLAWPSRAIMPIALLCLAAFIGEGAMYDWSAIFIRDVRGAGVALAAWGFGAFSAAMAICRFLGDPIVDRLGDRRVLMGGSAIAVAGYALALLVPSPLAAIFGFALIGVGVANIVPILFAAAGRAKSKGAAIAAVATFGYGGALTGPAIIGFLAEMSNLTTALGFAGLLLLRVLLGARSLVSTR